MRIIDPVEQARDRDAQLRRISTETTDAELAEAVANLRVRLRSHDRAARTTCPCHPDPEMTEEDLFAAYRNTPQED